MRAKKGILVTRPATQSRGLVELINNMGAQPISLPLLKVEELPFNQGAKDIVLNLDGYDITIFISGNAVNIGMRWIDSYWPQYPNHMKWLAVGKSTGAKLASFGLPVIYPSLESSEGLLELDELTEVKNKQVLIVRGQEGREVLAKQLTERGAKVEYLNVYRRDREPWTVEELNQLTMQHQIEIVMLTSGAALFYFDSLVGNLEFKSRIRLILPSERLVHAAEDLGYSNCIQSNGADDESMADACRSLLS